MLLRSPRPRDHRLRALRTGVVQLTWRSPRGAARARVGGHELLRSRPGHVHMRTRTMDDGSGRRCPQTLRFPYRHRGTLHHISVHHVMELGAAGTRGQVRSVRVALRRFPARRAPGPPRAPCSTLHASLHSSTPSTPSAPGPHGVLLPEHSYRKLHRALDSLEAVMLPQCTRCGAQHGPGCR